MESKFMQERAEENRRIKLDQEELNEVLKGICGSILANKVGLEAEFATILRLLNMIEDIVTKYDEKDQNMVYWHTKELNKNFDSCVIVKTISKQLQKIKGDAVHEFFGGIDFLNLVEEISNCRYKLKKTLYIWKAQTVIKNIKYQFERIWNTDNDRYQIAVFKGMIAME